MAKKRKITVLTAILCMSAVLLDGCAGDGKKKNEAGLEYFNAGQYNEAAECFEQAIEAEQKNSGYYINAAYTWMELNAYDKAADCINEALSLRPDSQEVKRAEGILYYRMENYETALEKFNECLKMAGNTVGETEYDVLLYRADVEMKTGDPAAAAGDYTILIEAEGESADYCYLRAKAYLAAGNGAQAAADFKTWIGFIDDSDNLYFKAYEELKDSGFEAEAEEFLRKALDNRADTDRAKKLRGKVYYVLNDYVNALVEFQSLEDDKKNAEILMFEATSFEALGDLENAEKFYAQAVEKGSLDASVYYQLALCKLKLKDYEGALTFIERGLGLNDENYSQKLAYYQAVCYEYTGQFDTALEKFQSYAGQYGSDETIEHEIAFLKTRQ